MHENDLDSISKQRWEVRCADRIDAQALLLIPLSLHIHSLTHTHSLSLSLIYIYMTPFFY